MRSMVRGLDVRLLPFLALLLLASSCKQPTSDSEPQGAKDAAAEIAALQDELWQDSTASSVALRFREGIPVEHLDDLSFADYQDTAAKARRCVERIDALDLDGALDRGAISEAQWVDAKAIRWDCSITAEGERWFWHENVLTSYSSPLPPLAQVFSGLPLATGEQRQVYLDLLAQLPGYVAQLKQRVEGQAERGIYVWRPNHASTVALVRSLIAPEGSPGRYGVAPERLAAVEISDDQRQAFVDEAESLIQEQVNPALEDFAAYLESDAYALNTPEGVGASALPDGDAYYRFATRRSTTMDITPEEIHQRGLELVAQMEDEMAQLQRQVGFEGTTESFREELRTNPRFFPKSPDEVGERLMAAAEDMEKVVDQYFFKRPRAPYGVKRLDEALEGSQTYGFYQLPTPSEPKGYYNYNGSKLDERSWLNLRGVSLHELIPGHHFHLARQLENEQLSDYRRNSFHGAYTEGWGSYSSYLGMEAGVFDEDPYSAYGMYILEVFLANRLVVDPGMNLLGWSLEDGRQFMREHTLESQTQIDTESLRYSADMPAQALAYQMGKLKFIELRDRAATELGDDFDIRAFHEAVLEHGSLPMAVLEEVIDRFIAENKK
jgi:uncharacterized protein (DUF885 family)